jgi:hypothetical protein
VIIGRFPRRTRRSDYRRENVLDDDAGSMTPVRRLILLVLLAAIGGAAFNWWRERTAQPTADDAPAWPPLETVAAPEVATATSAEPTITQPTSWAEPTADGSCPDGFPIKANDKSGIYHVPGGRFYDRTKPERCYTTAEAALADGYRQAKS